MKEIDTLVLGDGVSALSCMVVNKDAVAFTRNDDGMSLKDAPHPLGPQYLHSTRHTRQFYREFLDTDPESLQREINFKYVYDGDIHSSLDEDTLVEYYEKSRGTRDVKEKETVGSEQETSFQMVETLPEYASRVYDQVEDRIYESEEGVTEIDLDSRTLKFDGETYRFKQLVSTIPAPVFKGLVKNKNDLDFPEKFESTGTTFYVVENPSVGISSEYLDEVSELDYIYFPKNDLYRATVFKGGIKNTWTVEVNEKNDDFEEGDVLIAGADSGVITIVGDIKMKIPIKGAKTLNDIEMPKIGGVFYAGRFARWSHSIKTDDVIRRLMIGDLPIAKGQGDKNGQ